MTPLRGLVIGAVDNTVVNSVGTVVNIAAERFHSWNKSRVEGSVTGGGGTRGAAGRGVRRTNTSSFDRLKGSLIDSGGGVGDVNGMKPPGELL